MLQRKNNVRIGIAGWGYPDWKRIVCPAKCDLNKLKYMAQFFQAIEINTTTGKNLPLLRDISSNRSYATDGDDESLVLFPED